jgi:hypothetical protein
MLFAGNERARKKALLRREEKISAKEPFSF